LGRFGGLFCALMLALAGPAAANSPQPLMFGVLGQDLQNPVEQQSPNFMQYDCGSNGTPTNRGCDPSTWVNNPTSCVWDVDDYIDVTGYGTLNGTASGSLCIVADGLNYIGGDNHPIQVRVTAQSQNLVVTLKNDQGVSVVAGRPTPFAGGTGGGNWAYTICTSDLTSGPYATIADSNGGTGRIVNYTLTVSSAKKTNGVFAVLQAGDRQMGIC